MSSSASLPKGTRDFLPLEMVKRRYIFDTIRAIFDKYNYQCIETPAMERLSSLTGKYGEEGDRLIFKILNNGDFLSSISEIDLKDTSSSQILPKLSKRALRYDLTVPFARFVVMHQNAIQFPFKRYQIQPVWRADRPQKGRYQEFYQCDVDVVGSDSLIYEAELVQIYAEVFKKLKLNVIIHINHRKVLSALANKLELGDNAGKFITLLDKLDKLGQEGLFDLLKKQLNMSDPQLNILENFLSLENYQKLPQLLGDSEYVMTAVEELTKMESYLGNFNDYSAKFAPSLARGLNYYTGCIFEVTSDDVRMGSIGGGGRYDNLTEIFGLANMSGVGISFGAERIYDVLEELKAFPDSLSSNQNVLIIALDEESLKHGFSLSGSMRKALCDVELYPDVVKMKKSMKYANARDFGYVIIIGESERESGQYALKNMREGSQSSLSESEMIELLKKS